MSFRALQTKIRKLKSPLAVRLCGGGLSGPALSPAHTGLMEALAGVIPAVLLETVWYEAAGFQGLADTLAAAERLGFYVIADRRGGETGGAGHAAAQHWLEERGADALTVSPYCGSAGILPALEAARGAGKSIFVLAKTTAEAGELQDMVAGDRQVYTVAGDLTERLAKGGEGYQPAGLVLCAACAAEGKALRRRLESTFFLLTDYGTPAAGPQEVSGCFDHYGHGAIAAECGVLQETFQASGPAAARAAAEAMRDALKRYVTIV